MSEPKTTEEWAAGCFHLGGFPMTPTDRVMCVSCARAYAAQELAPFVAVARAAQAFDEKFTKIKGAIDGAFAFQQIHGFTYRGEHCREELRTMQAALSHPAVQARPKETRDETYQ